MTEKFLQYVWQHQLLRKDIPLVTTDGQPLLVEHPGEVNYDAGPDFFNARLSVGEIRWVGNVEIHIRSTDWNAHHHSADKRYNNIILHVVYEDNGEVVLENGKKPATLQLKDCLAPGVEEKYRQLVNPSLDTDIACADYLPAVPEFTLNNFLGRLAIERIEEKASSVSHIVDKCHGSWNQACYWIMAHYFGGRVNALPFELLAKSTDQRLLSRWRDNPQRIEALLFGQAGLLDDYFDDEYPRQLQVDYAALKSGASLTPIDAYLWKFYKLRPASFPTIRISQFANLLSTCPNLFDALLSLHEVPQIESLLNQEASSYWDTHYQFDRPPHRASKKRVGVAQADVLIVNAWVPLLFVYGMSHGQQEYKDQALDLLHQLSPENNHIIRRWIGCGIRPQNAAQGQALIQLYNEYCHRHRCLECSMGYYVIKNP